MRLIRHSIYNLVGFGLPLIVAIFTIPVLVTGLGDSKFGLLTLIWALVSYFGAFDLGLGRALTQQLASILDGPDHNQTGQTVVTSLVLMLGLGILASLIILIFGPFGIEYIKSISNYHEALYSIYIMAFSMPFILLTSGFRGILESKNKFGIINAIRLPMGLFTFIGPMLGLVYFGPNLEIITAILVLGRVLACIGHGWFAWISIRKGHGKFAFNLYLIRPLCFKGGWMTVSNVISPLMGYVDRFMIGFTVSAAAVAFYATPQEIVTKLSIIPGALTAVLFPAFASEYKKNNSQTLSIFKFSVSLIFLILLPISLFIVFFSEQILTIWIDKNFSLSSQIYLKVFAVGVLINCITHIPFTLIQSAGFAKTTAKIHLIQFPVYCILLLFFIYFFGVLGAALAWLVRKILDSVLMFSACYRVMTWDFNEIFNIARVIYVILLIIIFSIGFFENFAFKIMMEIVVSLYSFYCILIAYNKYTTGKNNDK